MNVGLPLVGSVAAPARTFFGLGLERAVQRERPAAQPPVAAGERQVPSNQEHATAGAPNLRPEGGAATLPEERTGGALPMEEAAAMLPQEAAVVLPYDGAMALLATASEVG